MTGERRENIARALWEAEDDVFGWVTSPWPDISETTRNNYRRLADAAIAAIEEDLDRANRLAFRAGWNHATAEWERRQRADEKDPR